MPRIPVEPLGLNAYAKDALMYPLMRVLSGSRTEHVQLTHPWNNHRWSADEFEALGIRPELGIDMDGDPTACEAWKEIDLYVSVLRLPMFHMPIFGGWRKYSVIRPEDPRHTRWHAGWVAGVSRIPLTGAARLLHGRYDNLIFGVCADTLEQIKLRKLGEGHIGDKGPFERLPLL